VRRSLLPILLLVSACSQPAVPSNASGLEADSAKIAAAILSHEARLPREFNPTCLELGTHGLPFEDHRRSLQYLRTESPANPAEAALRSELINYHSSPPVRWRRPGTSVAYNGGAGVPLPEAESARLNGSIASIIGEPPQSSHLARIEPGSVPWSLRSWGRWGLCSSTLSLSAPAFQEDLAFVETSYGCGGPCGYGWVYALRREGEDWKIVGTALTWMS
jgi:hypothetical protein